MTPKVCISKHLEQDLLTDRHASQTKEETGLIVELTVWWSGGSTATQRFVITGIYAHYWRSVPTAVLGVTQGLKERVRQTIPTAGIDHQWRRHEPSVIRLPKVLERKRFVTDIHLEKQDAWWQWL
jgi:hypothetical protein